MKIKRAWSLAVVFVLLIGMLSGIVLPAAAAQDTAVVYSESFDKIELNAGQNDNGWYLHRSTDSKTSASIREGALYIEGSTAAKSYDTVYLKNGDSFSNYVVEADITLLKDSGWFGFTYNVVGNTTYQRATLNASGTASLYGLVSGSWKNNGSANKAVVGVTLLKDQTVRYKIATSGAEATFSYAVYDADGTLGNWMELIKVTNLNSNTQSGSIGIMLGAGESTTSLKMDNITVTAIEGGESLFSEDFSYDLVGGDNNDLGWHFYKTSGTATTASVEDGALHITAGSTTPANTDLLYLNNGIKWSNYTLEADITYLKSTGFFCLAFNVLGNTTLQGAHVYIKNGSGNIFGKLNNEWVNKSDSVICSDPPKMGDKVRYKIVTAGTTATLYYAKYDADGVLGEWSKVVTNDDLNSKILEGTVGILLGGGDANASELLLDNITVSVPVDRVADIESDLKWSGRTYEEDGARYFNWTSAGFEMNIDGTGAAAEFVSNCPASNQAYLKVYVDGVHTDTVQLATGKTMVTLATGLDDGPHTIKVVKRTNGRSSTAGLTRLWVEDGTEILAPSARYSLSVTP